MRYFYYTAELTSKSTIIIVDEKSDVVKLFPGRVGYSNEKYVWLNHYEGLKIGCNKDCNRDLMYEICENQYKKFVATGAVPIDWDW